ncbi:hypothetical protein MSG28_011141 [Choristoneura fumiferana]|uniref:Uncharacterized protein n=1 Tax=Choristoneura fumiferana TaxID=7141 RepID=A0ACC0KR09_CHOFU|nr:hypothetical protein MSG28_011141 [Choristoneura fumiferana]
MSSKTKKTVTSSSNISVVSSVQSPQQSSTPVGSRPSSSAGRPSSPLSPTRHSRLQEKDALQNLNDRLAAYIDKVRQLESENSGLRREIQSTQEVVTREVSNIKGMYEHELQDARKLLDDTSREKAKLEIDLKRLYEENDDLKKRHAFIRLRPGIKIGQGSSPATAPRVAGVDSRTDLAKELEKLRKVYADTRKTLEEEMLCRIDMENTVQSLREELSFKDQMVVWPSSTRQSCSRVYRSCVNSRKPTSRPIVTTSRPCMRISNAATVAVEELRTMRTRIDSLNTTLNDLENKNAALSNRCRELERQLESERARHAEDLASLEQELARLRDEMAGQLREYATLMDIKISLDHEIATLNLTNQSPGRESRASVSGSGRGTPGRRATPLRAARKRTLLDESEERSLSDFSVTASAKGDLEVAEACPDGNIKINGLCHQQEQSLSGYQIHRKAGDQETVFKFHRTVKLEPGATATVWSADCGAEHDPPRDIVMKGQKWFVADNFTTALLNNEQELGEIREGDENCRIM